MLELHLRLNEEVCQNYLSTTSWQGNISPAVTNSKSRPTGLKAAQWRGIEDLPLCRKPQIPVNGIDRQLDLISCVTFLQFLGDLLSQPTWLQDLHIRTVLQNSLTKPE